MCSRYEISATAREIMKALSLKSPPPLANMLVIRPTDVALIVMEGNTAVLQPWGLNVDWTKQPMINARSETLTEKPTFRGLLEQRCLIPVSAYFEWRELEDGSKRKNTITASDTSVMTMAGLTDGTRFTMITCDPSPAIAHIHNRMPVILEADAASYWMTDASFDGASSLLTPYMGSLQFEEDVPEPPA
jgi:putative SOS response-associated peptidase YedK